MYLFDYNSSMDIIDISKNLHPLEIKVLLKYTENDELTNEKLIKDLDYKEGHANQTFSWLCGKGLLKEVSRTPHAYFEMTDVAKNSLTAGTIDERIIGLLLKNGNMALPDIASKLNLEQRDIGSSFGVLSKDKILFMTADKKAAITDDYKNLSLTQIIEKSARLSTIHNLLQKANNSTNNTLDKSQLQVNEVAIMATLSKKRAAADSLFKTVERETVTYKLVNDNGELDSLKNTLKAQGVTGNEIGQLTSTILEKGDWQGKKFRAYNIKLQAARIIPGRTNPYVDFLESVKDKLVGLGFQEFDGPLVETEFWNGDALFMPQFHAARDIHDVYRIKNPTHAKSIPEPYLTNVKNMHENGSLANSRGWNYKFDTEFTKRLILRSQGTVLSAHQLHKAQIPGKYFGIVRCFRYDKVDATHLSDFYQTEGIVLGHDVNLRTLLGFLKMFAVNIAGATEVKYVPGYFPFTEPSIEVHIKHPVLGWFELGGSGIFRPEVTKAMGLDCPVLAWGIGIDRMALMALGLNDLRELFCEDIERVRLRKAKI